MSTQGVSISLFVFGVGGWAGLTLRLISAGWCCVSHLLTVLYLSAICCCTFYRMLLFLSFNFPHCLNVSTLCLNFFTLLKTYRIFILVNLACSNLDCCFIVLQFLNNVTIWTDLKSERCQSVCFFSTAFGRLFFQMYSVTEIIVNRI